MNKNSIFVGIIIVALTVLSYNLWQENREVSKKLKDTTSLLVKERKEANTMRASLNHRLAKAQSNRVHTQEALDEEPLYRDTTVPDSVRLSLCSQIRCTGTSSVPASSR